jgi:hypothetical protein
MYRDFSGGERALKSSYKIARSNLDNRARQRTMDSLLRHCFANDSSKAKMVKDRAQAYADSVAKIRASDKYQQLLRWDL